MRVCGLLLGMLLLWMADTVAAQQLAFPSAEGFGRFSQGGRGGKAYHINSLNAGAGSGGSCNAGGCGGSAPFSAGTITFSDCLNDRLNVGTGTTGNAGARTCIFRVGGTISWASEYPVPGHPYLTIAGQTAPGDGIMLRNMQMAVRDTHNVIIRHLRSRPGTTATPLDSLGSFEVLNSHDVILDHVSAGWANDDTINIYTSDKVTIQWSIDSQGFAWQETLGYQPSKAMLIDQSTPTAGTSLLHNLYSEWTYRVPSINCCTVQQVNNVIYDINLGTQVYPVRSAITAEFVNNYFLRGPYSDTPDGTAINTLGCGYDGFVNCTFAANSRVYVSGNFHSTKRTNTTLPETNILVQFGSPKIPVSGTTLGMPTIPSLTSAQQARTDVLAKAGAYAVAGGIATVRRDSIDANIVTRLNNNTGIASDPFETTAPYGSYPTYANGTPYTDTDGDGIADSWETSHGLNPNNAADGPLIASNGYSNLENFINELAGDTVGTVLPAPTNLRLLSIISTP